MVDRKYCITPDILMMGHEDHPGVIGGIAKAFVANGSNPNRIIFGAIVDTANCLPHGYYERHAGTLLWLPAARQTSRTGAKMEQLMCGADEEVDWKDIPNPAIQPRK
jgi:hypothetical protein